VGAAFSFAHFINPNGGPDMVRLYKERFRPSPELAAPLANVAIFVLCADTETKAQELADGLALQMLKLETGDRTPIGSTDSVRNYPLTPELRARLDYHHQRMVFGTPEQVREQLEKLAASYGVNEITAVTITYDFQDRLRSYELLAEVFELNPVAQLLAQTV
jgi:alkanesulfonate monooxygenase SsuD/methylene tetrahydromethanopterin reductase-like flavin-dependent oxidoreductase (luciferase family)